MKFVEFVKKHCFLVIALVIILIVMIAGIIVAKSLFFSSKGDSFGNRLEGIDNHPISDSDITMIKDSLESDENVISIEKNLVGKRLDFILKVKSDTDVIKAKELADKILENLSDDTKSFYDIQIMIINEDEENQNYPLIGYQHKTKTGFIY